MTSRKENRKEPCHTKKKENKQIQYNKKWKINKHETRKNKT